MFFVWQRLFLSGQHFQVLTNPSSCVTREDDVVHKSPGGRLEWCAEGVLVLLLELRVTGGVLLTMQNSNCTLWYNNGFWTGENLAVCLSQKIHFDIPIRGRAILFFVERLFWLGGQKCTSWTVSTEHSGPG